MVGGNEAPGLCLPFQLMPSAQAAKELWVGKTLGLAAVGEGPQGHVQLCCAHGIHGGPSAGLSRLEVEVLES